MYIDNIRIFLTILVVLHHIAIGYGGAGDWIIVETPTDAISPIVFTVFNAVNQSFFMSLFFLISGFFLPLSYDRKGPKRFIRERLVRLGIPILFYAFILSPIISYLLLNFVRAEELSLISILKYRIVHRVFNTGPLWFVEILLLYSFMYVAFRVVVHYFNINVNFQPFRKSFPSNRAVVLSIVAIALGTFFIRIWYPVGAEFYHFQLGHHVHYVFCFVLGTLTYRGDWFTYLSAKQGKLWGTVALVNIVLLPIIFVVAQSLQIPLETFFGGFTWLSLVTVFWDSIGCLAISIWMVSYFKRRLNQQGSLSKTLSPNTYTVYIIHVLVALFIQGILMTFSYPSPVKFLIAGIGTVTICFLVSHFLIRKIPYTRVVLG